MRNKIMGVEDSYTAIIDSPVGKIGIKTNELHLTHLSFLASNTSLLKPISAIAQNVISQLNSYFNDAKHIFTLDFFLSGTPYQEKVWQALRAIPVSKVKTYGELAENLTSGPRAVGNACRHNPIPIIVPCHRIVAANHMGGFAGNTIGNFIDIKRWLLQHEHPK